METLRCNLAVLLGITLGLSAIGTQAQEQDLAFEEIIVSAQKREQSLQDVPISIAVLTGDKLEEAGIENLDDLALYVPNFSKGESGAGPIIQIRGIGTGANPAFEQSVVMYMDDISLSRAPLARMPFMDLERVEVLRGPQNVLFGKNSIAGAISLVTAKPTDEFEGSLSLRYGEYDDGEAIAVLSGPVSDSLRGRLAVRYADFGGYYENAALGRDEEQREETAIRATLAWDVGDDVEAVFKFERDTVDSIGEGQEMIFGYGSPLNGLDYPTTVAAIQDGYNAVLAMFGLPPVDVGSDEISRDRIRRSAFDGYQELDLTKIQLTFNQEFDDYTFTSVTGFVEYDEDRLAGGGLTGIDISSVLTSEEYKQISQEIRFTSNTGGSVDWIAGAFFQAWDLQADEDTLVDDMNLPVLLGVAGFSPGLEAVANLNSFRNFTGDSTTYAAFGQITWHVSDSARITLGGRYTREKKTGRRFVDIINTLTGVFDPTDPTQAITASCGFDVDYNSLGELSNGPFGALIPDCDGNFTGPGAYSTHDAIGERTENAFTPSLTVEFDIGEGSMLYGSASTGFKAGGFDARAGRESNLEYEDEQVTGFEFGLKSLFAGGKAQTNLALFHSSYEDLQVSTFDGVAGFIVGNAAEYTAQGVEFDGRWRATDSLTLSGSLAWIDAEWDKYDNASCNQYLQIIGEQTFPCDRTGTTPGNTPELSGNLIVDYLKPFSNSLSFRATLDVLYEDEYFTEPTKEVGTIQDAYTKYNLRLALEGGRWTFAVLGKNLSDEEVLEFSSPVPLAGEFLATPAYYGYLQPPRTVSAQFDYRF
ncbi:MAG: TonB-dependent receptor [Gammaproteobacteria bacterium]|nr:TonB-dependent receptor [Gammaproteobacteria bacterium]